MAKCLVFVAEVILAMPDFYLIAIMVYTHSRQTCICVRFPRIERILLILASADFAQIFDVIVKPIAVDVVNLHRRKPPVVPSPDYDVHLEFTMSATDIKIHKQISVFTISLTVRPTFNHPARLLVHKPAALGVVSVVLFHAKQQLLQLRFSQIFSIHNFVFSRHGWPRNNTECCAQGTGNSPWPSAAIRAKNLNLIFNL